jgi:hypothetical protein
MSHPDELTITLRKPVKLADVEYAQINLREPTAGELRKARNLGSDNGIGNAMALIHLVAQVPMAVVEQLSQRDLAEADRFLGGFTLD